MSEKQRLSKAKLESEGYIFSLAMEDGTMHFSHESKKFFSGHEPQSLKASILANGDILSH